MLRSSTQLFKSHGDDLGLQYVCNGDEYSSLENSLKAMEENAEYKGQPEILAPSACYRRTNHCSLRRLKGTVSGEFFTDRPGIDIIIQKNVTTKEN